MIRQYFTYRLMPIRDGFLKPDNFLNNQFPGLDFSFKLEILKNTEMDGRRLGYLESDDQEKIDSVAEGLSAYGYHAKTPESALSFCEYLYPEKNYKIINDILYQTIEGADREL